MDEYYDQLLGYVKQMLAQGYKDDAIRTTLSQSNTNSELIEKLLEAAHPAPNVMASTKQSNLAVTFTKIGTIGVVVAITFLVRTTGALQQTATATTSTTQQPIQQTGQGSADGRVAIINTNSDGGSQSSSQSSSSTANAQTAAGSSTTVGATGATSTTNPTKTSVGGSVSSGSSASPSPETAPVPSTPKPSSRPSPLPSPSPTYTYKNGTYTAVGSCNVPGSTEKISITLVITNDIVTSTSATNMATNSTSRNYENIFINNYTSLVVGKSLKSLNLGKVSSASLTPVAFNNAVNSIKSQAL